MRTRQLATVVFADIAGYTALMQRDEPLAIRKRSWFRNVMEEQVAMHNGRVVQYYGDGCLSLFNSAMDAVLCAIDVQKAMLHEAVPLRMGMHLGDVTVDDDGAWGDAVNIAARVESFAVTGSVFLSRKVYDQVYNQPDIRCKTLGKFRMKNVSETIELFAIANEGFPVPEPDALHGKGEQEKNSIAVLAFTNMSNDPDQDFFGDGISEEIINILVKLPDLKVAGRTSSFSFKGRSMDLRVIGKQLGVANVLEGSIRKAGNRIRVTAQLVKAEDGFHIWSERYDRELQNIFDIQDDIAYKITQKLKLTLLDTDISAQFVTRVSAPTDNIEAYQLYLRGRYLLGHREHIDQALEYFEKARHLDPNYALAWSGLSYVHFYKVFFGGVLPRTAFPLMRETALKAISLDPNISEPHLMFGLTKCYFDWDFKGAEESFMRAVEINPRSFDVYRVMGYFYSLLGDYKRTMSNIEKALELDPLNLSVRLSYGELLFRTRQFGSASEVLDGIVHEFPDVIAARYLAGAAHFARGNTDKALEHATVASEMHGPASFYALAAPSILARAGRRNEAIAILDRFEQVGETLFVSPTMRALVRFDLGETEEARRLVLEGMEARDPVTLIMNIDPAWEPYKGDEVVKKVLRDIGLSPRSTIN